MAVPLERLAGLVRHFPSDAEITITADDHAATIVCSKSRFTCWNSVSKTRGSGILLGEQIGCVELDARIARDLFARPAFAASTEESRPYLNGIFLHTIGDDLTAVAADGYGLPVSRCRLRPRSRRIAR